MEEGSRGVVVCATPFGEQCRRRVAAEERWLGQAALCAAAFVVIVVVGGWPLQRIHNRAIAGARRAGRCGASEARDRHRSLDAACSPASSSSRSVSASRSSTTAPTSKPTSSHGTVCRAAVGARRASRCGPISPPAGSANGRAVLFQVSITERVSVQSRQRRPAPPGPPRVRGAQARFALARPAGDDLLSPSSHRPLTSTSTSSSPPSSAPAISPHRSPSCAPPRVLRATPAPSSRGLLQRPCPLARRVCSLQACLSRRSARRRCC